jgi:hypothetical protein
MFRKQTILKERESMSGDQFQKRRLHTEHATPKGVRGLELSRTINISLLRSDYIDA